VTEGTHEFVEGRRKLLVFVVTLKVVTPCLSVLRVMWGAWCMVESWLFYNG
jgi:hypothetical protein